MFNSIVKNDEEEDDDDFFSVGSVGKTKNLSQNPSEVSSKLSNLFESSIVPVSESSKSSLFYKPKSIIPKTDSISKVNSVGSTIADLSTNTNSNSLNNKLSSSSSSQNIFCAAAVDVHKFENGKYSFAGKFGMALLGNDNDELSMSYRLILYTAKQKPICQATIGENFKFLCQANNYANFYDDNRQNWSVRFTNLAASVDERRQFCMNIAHCRFGAGWKSHHHSQANHSQKISQKASHNNDSMIISQDLCPIELESPVEKNLCIALSVHTFQPNQSLYQNKNPAIFYEKSMIKINRMNNPLISSLNKAGDSRMLLCSKGYLIENSTKFSEISSELFNKMMNQSKEMNDVWKFALEIVVVVDEEEEEVKDVEEQEEVTRISMVSIEPEVEISKPTMKDSKEPVTSKSTDLASRMAKIGAKPVFSVAMPQTQTTISVETPDVPVIQNSSLPVSSLPPKPQPRQNINHKVSNDIPKSENDSPSTSITNQRLAQICLDITEIKRHLLSPPPAAATSSLTMDSTILLNSIQKLVEENHRMKQQLEEKNVELRNINSKLLELIPNSSSSSSSSTPENELPVVDLSREISQLKVQLTESNGKLLQLQEKNYLISMENLQLDRKLLQETSGAKDSRNSLSKLLKQALNQVYSLFSEKLPEVLLAAEAAANENEKPEVVTNLLSSVMIDVKKSLMLGSSNNSNNSFSPQRSEQNTVDSKIDEVVNRKDSNVEDEN